MTLDGDQFDEFFVALWGDKKKPFPWQSRLAKQVCKGQWPKFIDLPTASGKTACLDIAVFALAMQASWPVERRTVGRRIFFVVNRRVIVDEAYERALKMAERINGASNGVLCQVAQALRQVSSDPGAGAPPLDVALLRGGVYRDNRWARSISQPTIITSTIDQVGSRLLFRGYGVSDGARPMHAALIAHDSTILLDEAHISQPFVQTLDAVQQYRSDHWAKQSIPTPFAVVQMTATPGSTDDVVFRLDDKDRQNETLKNRRNAKKPAQLIIAEQAKGKGKGKGKGKDKKKGIDELAKVLVTQALSLQSDGRLTVAIIVNRVATARTVYEQLKEQNAKDDAKDDTEVHLAIGRMRPIDRVDLIEKIQKRVGKNRDDTPGQASLFVVATQCLEVGADFDFDAMVSECASLDALRQRFGRLNRMGRTIESKGCIVIRLDQIKTNDQLRALDDKKEQDDPIYGNALARTWNWLQSVATDKSVDFGIAAMKNMTTGMNLSQLLAPRADAPVMFPAYVDAWAQTHPSPCPDPDVSLFLHGPQRGEPDVNICWRADLPKKPNEENWKQIVSLCPPSSPECMAAPIGLVRAWLAKKHTPDDERSDMLDAKTPENDDNADTASRHALAWRGLSKNKMIDKPNKDIHPGDTLVLPVSAGGWSVFGHIPDAPPDPAVKDGHAVDLDTLTPVDIAEQAYHQSRGRAILRLHPTLIKHWSTSKAVEEAEEDEEVSDVKKWMNDVNTNIKIGEIRGLLKRLAKCLAKALPNEQTAETLEWLAKPAYGLTYEQYPNDKQYLDGEGIGLVLRTRRHVRLRPLPAMDDGDDELSRTTCKKPVALEDHTKHVSDVLKQTLEQLSDVESWKNTLQTAADLHDWGKADERFQALLLDGDPYRAGAQETLWAKSADIPTSFAQRSTARRRSQYPDGFRHEMLSVQLAQCAFGRLPDDNVERDLVLHLIASHHGRARPFAPVIIDDKPPDVSLKLLDVDVCISSEQRKTNPPHRLDSGIAERFWKLTRHLGWWGLAYLETILRLADQRASQQEDESDHANTQPASQEVAP